MPPVSSTFSWIQFFLILNSFFLLLPFPSFLLPPSKSPLCFAWLRYSQKALYQVWEFVYQLSSCFSSYWLPGFCFSLGSELTWPSVSTSVVPLIFLQLSQPAFCLSPHLLASESHSPHCLLTIQTLARWPHFSSQRVLAAFPTSLF